MVENLVFWKFIVNDTKKNKYCIKNLERCEFPALKYYIVIWVFQILIREFYGFMMSSSSLNIRRLVCLVLLCHFHNLLQFTF